MARLALADDRVASFLAERGELGRVDVSARSPATRPRGATSACWRAASTQRGRALPRAVRRAASCPSSSCASCWPAGACRCPRSSTWTARGASCWLEDLGDVTLQEALREASAARARRDYYAQALDQLVRLQREAAQGPQGASCFQIAFDIEKLSLGAALLPEALRGGRCRGCDLTVEDRARWSRTGSTGWPRRSRPGRACSAIATSTAAT